MSNYLRIQVMEKKAVSPNRLKEILEIEGLTQVKFAKLTDKMAESICTGTINKICTCNYSASNRHKHIIVKALNKYLGQEKYTVDAIF